MRYDLVVFGLSLSSSWGNGHATTYRALLKAYAARGHKILFLEREQPWYAAHRDLHEPDFCALEFYDSLAQLEAYRNEIAEADAVIVGSYVPEGIVVGRFVQKCAKGLAVFYDIDTPVTIEQLEAGTCAYVSGELIAGYPLYLSFTGGPTLDLLMGKFGSPAARALYCSVDESLYKPTGATPQYDLGYLGTYSPDRQPALERLLIEPARRAPHRSFIIGGSLYPDTIDWPANVVRKSHVPPAQHAAFYNSCRFALNVTRADMIRAGYSPSVRLFEAAACGTPVISDPWEGLDTFFRPSEEIAFASSADDVLALLDMSEPMRRNVAEGARRRVLGAHTAAHRAAQLEAYVCPARARAAMRADPLRNKPFATAFV